MSCGAPARPAPTTCSASTSPRTPTGSRLWSRLARRGGAATTPRFSASLWWQAYSYRVAGMTLAAWALSGAAPDPAALGTGVGLERNRPSSLLVDPAATVVADLDTLVDHLFAGHLDPVAGSLRAHHGLGARLIWGDTAAGVASALGATGTAEAHRRCATASTR
ncbi:MAG: ferric iron reductase [Acidimicrobiales bacterium]